MEFYKNLYVSESLETKQDTIIKKLRAGKPQLSCYVIVLAEKHSDQLEFFDSVLLSQHWYAGKHFFVAGIASCYEEALELVRQMTEDTYREQGDADIRLYLRRKQDMEENEA